MDPILAMCERYNIPVVEDAAEALGATYKGRAAGSMGAFSFFSFNGNKIITTSGGGTCAGPSLLCICLRCIQLEPCSSRLVDPLFLSQLRCESAQQQILTPQSSPILLHESGTLPFLC